MLIAAAVLLSSCAADVGGAGYIGGLKLSDEWNRDMAAGGLALLLKPEKTSVIYEIGMLAAESSAIFESYSILEFYAGVMKIWPIGQSKAHCYVGAATAYIRGRREPFSPPDYEDSTVGGFVHGGVYRRFEGKRFNLGVEYRYVFNLSLAS